MTELPTWMATAGAIAATVGTVGGLAGVAAIIKARAEKGKINAETDKVEVDAAAQLSAIAITLVEPLKAEVTRLSGRVSQLETNERIQHMLLVDHSVWDHLAVAELRRADIEMPTIPPLFAHAVQAQQTADEAT